MDGLLCEVVLELLGLVGEAVRVRCEVVDLAEPALIAFYQSCKVVFGA